jgi:16S rRNA (adenine1518-N6/adenine1519-N6)-dimethyltransferase
MRAKRSLSQHFLHDPRILGRIAEALAFAPGDQVVEIGPGRGALTAELLSRGAIVTAIEMDRDLLPGLVRRFPLLRLAHGDALDLDWAALAGVPAADLKVIGNIPYHITSPLIDKALAPPRPRQVVFLIQKEVADRIAAAPGSREYGALSVGVQAVSRVERLFVVPAGAFQPPPKVDSAVIRLTPLAEPLVYDREVTGFRRLVTGLFSARRKQLQRGVRQLTGWPAADVDARLAGLGIDGTRRPETLSPAEFVALHRTLVDAGWGSRVAL